MVESIKVIDEIKNADKDEEKIEKEKKGKVPEWGESKGLLLLIIQNYYHFLMKF